MKSKEEKKRIVKEISEMLKNYRTIGFIDFFKMPTFQFQQIKEKLRNKVVIKYMKKKLLLKAFENFNGKNVEKFLEYLPNQIGILFTNEDPVKIYSEIRKYVSYREAVEGDIAPSDIVIKPQITNLPPGPVISELQEVGLVVGIEKGKIAIKKEKVLVKKGEKISAKIASVLKKLGIKPIEVSLNITALYNNGIVFPKEILEISEEEIISDINKAFNQAISLGIEINYPCEIVLEKLIEKVWKIANNLSIEICYPTKKNIKDLLFKGYVIAENVKKMIGV